MPESTPRNTSAPSGARMPHRPTPPVGSHPPMKIIESVGAMAMARSWMFSSWPKSRVRAKRTIDATEMTA